MFDNLLDKYFVRLRASTWTIFCPGFYPDALGLGEIASIGGAENGVWGCAPAGPRSKTPGQGVCGAKTAEA